MAKDDLKKYYKILDVSPDAPWEEVRQVYRDLMKVWHPDRFINDKRLSRLAEEKTKEITNAFKKIEEDSHSIKFSFDNFGESPEYPSFHQDKPDEESDKKGQQKKESQSNPKLQAREWFDKAQSVASGDYRTTIEYLTRALELDPFFEKAFTERGAAWATLNHHEQAAQDFTEAILLNPRSFDGYRGRASSYYESGNYLQSVRDFSAAIAIEPDGHPELYYLRGKAYERMGFREETERDFKKNEALRTSNPESTESYGTFQYEKSKIGMSTWLFRSAVCLLILTTLFLAYPYIKKIWEQEAREVKPVQIPVPSDINSPKGIVVEETIDSFIDRNDKGVLVDDGKKVRKANHESKDTFEDNRKRGIIVIKEEKKKAADNQYESAKTERNEKQEQKRSEIVKKKANQMQEERAARTPESKQADDEDKLKNLKKIEELEKAFPLEMLK